MAVTGEKECCRCFVEKDVSEFNRSSKAKDGLQSWCRQCQQEEQKQRPRRYFADTRTWTPTIIVGGLCVRCNIKVGDIYWVWKVRRKEKTYACLSCWSKIPKIAKDGLIALAWARPKLMNEKKGVI